METYIDPVVSWEPVLITHSCGVGVNWSRTIIKVPQALHIIRFGRDIGLQDHHLIDESVLRCCIQNSTLQQVLHPDLLGDVLRVQNVEGLQVDGQ